jgi:NADH dehydrogenase
VVQFIGLDAKRRYPESLATATRDASAVVNLVGILYERGRQRFDAVQADGAEAAAQVAAAHRARFVQASAIGADEASTSSYGRTKADGEKRVFAAVPNATIFRPSIIFGPDDDFFNRFAALARFAPALPLVGGGETKFQPVFVGDVAEAVAKAVDGTAKAGTVYELGGPEIFTFKELMEYDLSVTGRKRLLVPMPFFAARLIASFLQFAPKPLLTPDQVELLRTDNLVSEDATREHRTLAALGITPRSVAAVVPSYLWRFRKTGQFQGHIA